MNSWQPGWRRAIACTLATLGNVVFPVTAWGQIVPDQTLGNESSVVLPSAIGDLIEGGAQRGDALFHSFVEFNVLAGQRVYFANPIGIEAILSRVTGLNPSQIEGLLGVNGSADLYLLNPNGIVFGPNAQLDVAGSFVASTGDRITFADGTEFRATNPNAAPLVTVNIPLGLQLAPEATAPLVNQADLAVGGDLTLAAGSVSSPGALSAPSGVIRVEGGAGNVQVRNVTANAAVLSAQDTLNIEAGRLVTTGDLSLLAGQTVRLRDSATTPFVAAAGGDLRIQGNANIDILALNHPQIPFQSGGNLTLASDGPISGDARFFSRGSVAFLDLAGNPGTFISLYDPIISAQGDVVFGDYTGTALKVEATGTIAVEGDIIITGPDIELEFDPADPDIDILTSRAALILRAGVDAGAIGNTQFDLLIPTEVGNTFFSDPEGAIFDPATETPLPIGSILVLGNLDTTGLDEVYVQDGYTAGPIILDAAGNIVVDGSIDTSANFATVNSTAGPVSLTAGGAVTLRNGFQESSPAEGGAGGSVTINGVTITLQNFALLPTGNVDLTATQTITLAEESLVQTDTGETITLNAGQAILITDSGIFALGVSGVGGDINLNTNRLAIRNGSQVSTTGVEAPSPVTVGDINITVDSLLLSDESLILADASGEGASGANINLTANTIVAEPPTGEAGSDIVAVSSGEGGVITLVVGTLQEIAVRPERTPLNDIVGTIAEPPEPPDPPEPPEPPTDPDLIEEITDALEGESEVAEYRVGEFLDREPETVTDPTVQCLQGLVAQGGRGGLPTRPTDLLQAIAPTSDWVTLADGAAALPAALPQNQAPFDLNRTLASDHAQYRFCIP